MFRCIIIIRTCTIDEQMAAECDAASPKPSEIYYYCTRLEVGRATIKNLKGIIATAVRARCVCDCGADKRLSGRAGDLYRKTKWRKKKKAQSGFLRLQLYTTRCGSRANGLGEQYIFIYNFVYYYEACPAYNTPGRESETRGGRGGETRVNPSQ